MVDPQQRLLLELAHEVRGRGGEAGGPGSLSLLMAGWGLRQYGVGSLSPHDSLADRPTVCIQAMTSAGAGPVSPHLPHEQQRWGVLVGISSPDYSDIKRVHTPIGVYSATGVCGQELWVWIDGVQLTWQPDFEHLGTQRITHTAPTSHASSLQAQPCPLPPAA